MSLLDDDVVTSIESWPVIAWCLIDAGSYIWTIPVTANDDVNQIHVEGGIYTFRSGQRLPKDKDDNSTVRERLQAQLRRMRKERTPTDDFAAEAPELARPAEWAKFNREMAEWKADARSMPRPGFRGRCRGRERLAPSSPGGARRQ